MIRDIILKDSGCMQLSNFISLFSVECYTVESDGSEEEDVVILTADKSGGFQQRYDSGANAIPQILFSLSGAYRFSLLFGTSSLLDQNYRSFVIDTIIIDTKKMTITQIKKCPIIRTLQVTITTG